MVWIVVAVVVVAALGPLFWLLPSRRERRISAFRVAARRVGLAVEIASIEKLDASAEERVSAAGVPRQARLSCVAYRLPLPQPLFDAPRWQLLKSARDNHRCLPGWTVARESFEVPVQGDYWQRVRAIVDALPGGCVGVEATPGAIVWYGLERLAGDGSDGNADSVGAAVAAIRDGLLAVAALHEKLAPPTEPNRK